MERIYNSRDIELSWIMKMDYKIRKWYCDTISRKISIRRLPWGFGYYWSPAMEDSSRLWLLSKYIFYLIHINWKNGSFKHHFSRNSKYWNIIFAISYHSISSRMNSKIFWWKNMILWGIWMRYSLYNLWSMRNRNIISSFYQIISLINMLINSLIQMIAVLPATNVDCERDFSILVMR